MNSCTRLFRSDRGLRFASGCSYWMVYWQGYVIEVPINAGLSLSAVYIHCVVSSVE